MKRGFNSGGGVSGSVQGCQRLRQGSCEAKMVFDNSGGSGAGGEGGEQHQHQLLWGHH